MTEHVDIVQVGSKDYRVCSVIEDDIYKRICFEKQASGWVEVIGETVYLILRELACHSIPAPPEQMTLPAMAGAGIA
jgi:hypothetical protein